MLANPFLMIIRIKEFGKETKRIVENKKKVQIDKLTPQATTTATVTFNLSNLTSWSSLHANLFIGILMELFISLPFLSTFCWTLLTPFLKKVPPIPIQSKFHHFNWQKQKAKHFFQFFWNQIIFFFAFTCLIL